MPGNKSSRIPSNSGTSSATNLGRLALFTALMMMCDSSSSPRDEDCSDWRLGRKEEGGGREGQRREKRNGRTEGREQGEEHRKEKEDGRQEKRREKTGEARERSKRRRDGTKTRTKKRRENVEKSREEKRKNIIGEWKNSLLPSLRSDALRMMSPVRDRQVGQRYQ